MTQLLKTTLLKIYSKILHFRLITRSKQLVFTFAFLFLGGQTFSQGYIYVHKKTLNEESSLAFNFSLKGGPTTIPDFSLNDEPGYINIIDLGADISGGLWAAAGSSGLFYRAAGSSAWVQKVSGNVQRVDGAASGTCYYILGSAVYYFNGTSSTLIGKPGSVNAMDITSNGIYTVVTNTSGFLYKVNSASFTRVTTLPTGVKASYVDMDAASNIYMREISSSTNANRISKLTPGNIFSVYPAGPVSGNATDLAVSANGTALIQVGSGVQPPGYSYNGSTWIIEPESRGMLALAGGPGQQIWSIFTLPSKPSTIFTRTFTGTGTSNVNSAFWIDDERVRTTEKDNSILISVAAGTYKLTETIPAGWEVTNITLYDPTSNSTTNLKTGTASIQVANGEVVHVVVENTLLQTTAVATNCGSTFTENFGTGAVGTVGGAFTGLTSYHHATEVRQVQDGEYTLVSRSQDANYGTMFDHTSGNGTGRLLLVNASYAKDIFYIRQFTNMVIGASYDLSLWAGSVTGGIDPHINMEVYNSANNVLLASISTGDITTDNVWINFHLPFIPTTKNIYIVLRNNNIGGDGNDLVIDDISFGLTCDHADAPDSYGTTNANTGVGHIITPALTIGTKVDQEPDGIPNSTATGDDANGINDEDGVAAFPALSTGNTSYDLSVAVNNTIGSDAILSGWIDFNRNGVFDDGERAQTAVSGNATRVTLHWENLSGISVGLTYARLRLGTIASEVAEPTGSAQNGEVEDYTLNITVKISGNVFNDANGLADNTVNGPGISTTGLTAVLYDNTTGLVAAIAAIAADGSYSFDAVSGHNYSVYITTNTATVGSKAIPVVMLSDGWINTGEHIGTNAGNDGPANGVLILGSVTTSVTNADFGIERLPQSDPKIKTIPQPIVNQLITLDGTNVPLLTGSDPEDQPASASLDGKSVAITSLPTHGELYYNNVLITVGADGINPPSPTNPFSIPNLNPALLQIKLTGKGYTSVSFNYAYVDAAGKMDTTPATYTLNWPDPLPVTLVSFIVKAEGKTANLTWTTTAETNSESFTIERSPDGKNWSDIGQVAASGESSAKITYHFTDVSVLNGENLYRLKMTDRDGSFAFSRIVSLTFAGKSAVNLYPNPAADQLFIEPASDQKVAKVQLYNVNGILITEANQAHVINVSLVPTGLYIVRITLADGSQEKHQIVIKH